MTTGPAVMRLHEKSLLQLQLNYIPFFLACYCYIFPLTLFRLGFFGRPWTGVWGGGVKRSPPHFLKTIEDINMKLAPIIKRREINLLPLSYLSCDVT